MERTPPLVTGRFWSSKRSPLLLVLLFVSTSAYSQYVSPPDPTPACVWNCSSGTSIGQSEGHHNGKRSGPSDNRSDNRQQEGKFEKEAKHAEKVRDHDLRQGAKKMASLQLISTVSIPHMVRRNLPSSTPFFRIDQNVHFEEELKVPTGYAPGTPLAAEDLARAVSILGVLTESGSLSLEDVWFLGEQEDLALEGGPLQVVVPASSRSLKMTRSEMREVEDLLGQSAEAANHFAETVRERQKVEASISDVETRRVSDPAYKPGHSDKYYEEQLNLESTYKRLLIEESAAKSQLQGKQEAVGRVVINLIR